MADGSGEFSILDDGTLISGDSIMGEAISLARLGPGKRIGPYEILERLSVGDGGVHYRASDTRRDAVVVIRLLRPDRDQDELREDLEALAALRHPELATIHEVSLRFGVVCVAQDDSEGEPLLTWAKAAARGWSSIVEPMRQVASALATVHAAGQVYRELDPSKLHIDGEGQAQLGALRSLRERRSAAGQTRSVETSTISSSSSGESLSAPLLLIEGVPAAPAYLSPEQYAGQAATPQSDQFAFCVLLYEALYGERPFAARTAEGLFSQVEQGRIRPPTAGSRVPRWLRQVVVRGLAHDPAERWPSMDALVEALAPERGLLGSHRKLVLGIAIALALGGAAAALGTLV